MEGIKKYLQNKHSFSTYLALWFGLLMLTGLIVTASGLNLGRPGIIGIIGITVFQSTLLFLFFIHAKTGYFLFKFILGVALLILVALMFFALST